MYNHHASIIDKLEYFYKTQKIPNIIIHGSSGTGKRTIVYDFINKIYNNDKQKIKMNVMTVNCAHGKGIKFIREDLKFFAKTNVQSNTGVLFKSIILLNADFLTIDAQSALRRCIELFSHNTRFFIIVENKNKLLNPILSRFCEIYVPEMIENGKVVNLHRAGLDRKYPVKQRLYEWLHNVDIINSSNTLNKDVIETPLVSLQDLASKCYEEGLSCLDIIQWLDRSKVEDCQKNQIKMDFHRLRREFRCEKMLMFVLLYKINKSI